MNFFKVKFFPSKLEDYLYFCLSNIIFLITFVIFIHKNIDENNKNANKGEIMLFIPKIGNDYEEKRDLILIN